MDAERGLSYILKLHEGCLGQEVFNHWYYSATHSRIEPVIRVARTLKKHLDGLPGYFRHGITNAFTEGTNSRIQEIKLLRKDFGTLKITEILTYSLWKTRYEATIIPKEQLMRF